MTTRYKNNKNLGLAMWLLVVVLQVISFAINAQADSTYVHASSYKERFRGYALSLGTQGATLNSDIPELNGMRVSRQGASVGLVTGNEKYFIKSSLGLFYTAPSVPYSIDVMELNTVVQIYLHRDSKDSWLFEPYISSTLKALRSSFYGNYIDQAAKNRSLGSEKLVGRVISLEVMPGFGIEYRLRNENLDFINLFAEARYGVTVANMAMRDILSSTKMRNPLSFQFGIHFGKIKRTND